MFEKCSVCGSRILAGGDSLFGQPFCGDGCVTKFKIDTVLRTVPEETVQNAINEVFHSPCPQCNREGPLGVFSWTKVTGMLIAYEMQSNSVVCCANCGRKNRLLAAGHCLFLGWWSPRSFFINLFCLPANIIALLFIRKPRAPSSALTEIVMVGMSEPILMSIGKSLRARANQREKMGDVQ